MFLSSEIVPSDHIFKKKINEKTRNFTFRIFILEHIHRQGLVVRALEFGAEGPGIKI